MDALELLSGDARTFLDKVWASYVHVHHAGTGDLVDLLALGDVDHLLTGVALRTPALRVVKDGSVLPASRFTRSATMAGSPLTGLVDARKVLALFDGGATVVLQGLHRYWPPLTELVRDLELTLGHPCQANAYLTPPGSQGFARHSDTHDVFVFQTHGRKQWEVVEAGEERQVVLEPGLSMYLPTGTPHSARSQEETSLHVTVGINRLTWRDVLRQVGDRVLADQRYDEPLPAGYLEEPDRLSGRLAEELASFIHGLGDLDAPAVADERSAAFLRERTPTLRGGLTDLVVLDGLDDDTRLERRPTSACVLRPAGERLSVLLGDRELRMPLRLTEPMQFVRDHRTFRVGELAPWLDEQSRLVLTRRLVREGLLRIAL
ncbi:MAG TPA: cupin domain-containing protein [Nocardioidaceae bacterium]|nr:cupin domain-containing protein [Nocardioidaceae bacterium]